MQLIACNPRGETYLIGDSTYSWWRGLNDCRDWYETTKIWSPKRISKDDEIIHSLNAGRIAIMTEQHEKANLTLALQHWHESGTLLAAHDLRDLIPHIKWYFASCYPWPIHMKAPSPEVILSIPTRNIDVSNITMVGDAGKYFRVYHIIYRGHPQLVTIVDPLFTREHQSNWYVGLYREIDFLNWDQGKQVRDLYNIILNAAAEAYHLRIKNMNTSNFITEPPMNFPIPPPAEWLTTLASDTVASYKMDESHGMGHFLNVRANAMAIACHMGIPLPQMSIIADAAYAHDLIDSKYVHDVPEQLARVRDGFLQNGYTQSTWAVVEKILMTMSFSVRALRMKQGLPAIKIDHDWLSVAIVADADQLDAYDVNRCVAYQNRRFSMLSDSSPEKARLIRGWVKTILVNRVLQYRDKYMFTEIAKTWAGPRHESVQAFVDTELADAEVFDYP